MKNKNILLIFSIQGICAVSKLLRLPFQVTRLHVCQNSLKIQEFDQRAILDETSFNPFIDIFF